MYTSAYKSTLLRYQSCFKINASGDGHIENGMKVPLMDVFGANGLRSDDGLDSSSSSSKIYIGVLGSALVYNKVSASQIIQVSWRKVLTVGKRTEYKESEMPQRAIWLSKRGTCHELEIFVIWGRWRPQIVGRCRLGFRSG